MAGCLEPSYFKGTGEAGGFGARNRREFIGGSANGIPKNDSENCSVTPKIEPPGDKTTSGRLATDGENNEIKIRSLARGWLTTGMSDREKQKDHSTTKLLLLRIEDVS